MSKLTIELPAQEDQTEFNLRRWKELTADTDLGRDLARFSGRIKTNRHGHIIMYPPAGLPHGGFQSEIAYLLRQHLPEGRVFTECPISTADGVRAADVAWASSALVRETGAELCFLRAPEICVKVLSPGNSRRELAEKKALYFAAGALEVWHCDLSGKMTFHIGSDSPGAGSSSLCSGFPTQVVL